MLSPLQDPSTLRQAVPKPIIIIAYRGNRFSLLRVRLLGNYDCTPYFLIILKCLGGPDGDPWRAGFWPVARFLDKPALAHASTRQNRTISMVGHLTFNILPSELRLFNRTCEHFFSP